MIQTWKMPHIVKGMLTYAPLINKVRLRRGATGGSSSSRYCYAVWLRHLVMLNKHGFTVKGAAVGELGPGDSIGTGLAALLSGANRYVGLDAVEYSANADIGKVFSDLVRLYESRAPIPSHQELPRVRPRLASYDFPEQQLDLPGLSSRAKKIQSILQSGIGAGKDISYRAPWTAANVEPESLDLIFSQGVLQCVNDLEATYDAMFAWLKPGGYSSHSTGFWANYLSPFWNGHWAYSDLEWQLVRGRREYLLNREPLSRHLHLAARAGFEILEVDAVHDDSGLPVGDLAPRFQGLAAEDLRTCGAMTILRKPRHNRSS
jgi:hypothetical protein